MNRVERLLSFSRKLEALDPELALECRQILNEIVKADRERMLRILDLKQGLVPTLRALGNEVGILRDDIARPGDARIGDFWCRPCDRCYTRKEVSTIGGGMKVCPDCHGPVEIKT